MFSIAGNHLSAALKAAGQAVASKSVLPVLTHIRLQAAAGDGAVTFTGSDGHMSVIATVPADVEDEAVDICLPVDKLTAAAGMGAPTIIFTEKDGKTIARAGRCRLTIPTLPGRSFPEPKIVGTQIASFDAPGLTALIPTVAFAIAGPKQHDKPFLRSLWLECDGEAVHLVGCDGFMLAANCLPVSPSNFGEKLSEFGITITGDAAELLANVGAEHFEIYESHVVGSRDGVRVICNKQGAKYFDWRRMIPRPDQFVTFARNDLLQICPLHRIFDEQGAIRFEQDGGDCAISISNGTQSVDAEIELKARADEAHLDASFDGPNLLRLLSQVKTDDVSLSWASNKQHSTGVCLLQDGSWRGILSPLRA